MTVQLIHYIKGYVRIKVTGNSYDRFLNLCAYHQIRLWDLTSVEESYEVNISKQDFKKIKELVRKSHTHIQILQRRGIPFLIWQYRNRKFWLIGIGAAILLMFWLSSHIWLITIEGNLSQTDDVLFEYLDTIGICHGMKKKEVNCRQLAADIRNYFTDFTWVSVKLTGTHLEVAVKEGIVPQSSRMNEENTQETPTDLVASKAGTVMSILVRSGLPMVQAGDEVEPGTILVSGTLPIYDDSGSVKSYQYTSSDADIIIRSSITYEDQIPFSVSHKKYTGNEKKAWILQIGTFTLGFGSVKHGYEHSDFLRTIHQAKLFENFYLPLYGEELTVKEYQIEEKIRSKKEAETAARENFRCFLKNLEEKGVQLFENDVRIEWYENFCSVSGTLIIGQEAVRKEPTTGGMTDG